MNHRESPLYWAIPIGTWAGTRVRVSVFFPLVLLLFCVRLESVALGGAVTGVLFLSVLLHEYGHVIAARRTGGSGDEILIWPLGGLAYVQTQPNFQSRFVTAAAGPLVNLGLCVLTVWHVVRLPSLHTADVWNPFVMPNVDLAGQTFSAFLVITFTVNWALLLLNLIPVYPLDGGRMLQAGLTTKLGKETGTDIYIKVGFFFAFVMMFGGLMFDHTYLLFIGSIVLVLNMQESVQMRSGESYDESFMGYDFSQGYTSLERSEEQPAPRRQSAISRWKEKRQKERTRRQQEQEMEDARLLDQLLDKVHAQGMDSLTDAERRDLDRVSARIRNKNESSS